MFFLLGLLAAAIVAQDAPRPAAPSAAVTAPGTVTAAGFVPAPILQGGEVFLLYPPGSPFLKQDRVKEPEQNNMTNGVPGRIQSIVNIHNPSVELHRVERGTNTGAAVILIAGGGHNTLNVGTEGADFVSYFYQYGVTTVILRSRLRRMVTTLRPTRSTTRSRPSEWSARMPRNGASTRTRSA